MMRAFFANFEFRARSTFAEPTARMPITFLPLAILTCIGILFRLYHLGHQPLWLDEARLYWIAQGDWASIIANNAANNSAPPLFAILVALAARVNESEMGLRALSFLAGSVSIPMMFLLARRWLSLSSAYFLALLVAIAPTQILYSQQMREYSLTFLLATATCFFFDRYIRQSRTFTLALLIFLFFLDILTQYGLAILIAGFNLAWLVEIVRTRNKRLVYGFLIQLVFVSFAIVLAYQSALRFQMRPGGFGAGAANDYLAAGYLLDGSLSSLMRLTILNTRDLFNFAFDVSYLTLFVCAIGFAVLWIERQNTRVALMIVAPIVLTFLAAMLRLYPYGGMRQDMFLMPLIFILAGFGFDYIGAMDSRRIMVELLVLFLAGVGIAGVARYFNSRPIENIRPAVEMLKTQYRSGDKIYVYYGANPAFRYYYRNNVDQTIYGVESRDQPDRYFRQLTEVLTQPGRVWLVFSHCYNEECDQIVDYVARTREVCKVVVGEDVALYRTEEIAAR